MSSVAYAPPPAQSLPIRNFSIAFQRTRKPTPEIHLTRTEREILNTLFILSYGTGECWAPLATIAKKAQAAAVTVGYAIRRFLRLGFLKRKIHGRTGKRGGRSASVLSWAKDHPIWEGFQQAGGKTEKKPVAHAESNYRTYNLNPDAPIRQRENPSRTETASTPPPPPVTVLRNPSKETSPKPETRPWKPDPGEESCAIFVGTIRNWYGYGWRGAPLNLQDARDILAELPGELGVTDLLDHLTRIRFDPLRFHTSPGGMIRRIAQRLYQAWMAT